MAVQRITPTCAYCGKPTAEAVYDNQSDLPSVMRLIGDTFRFWKYKKCKCKQSKAARKKQIEQIRKNEIDLSIILNQPTK